MKYEIENERSKFFVKLTINLVITYFMLSVILINFYIYLLPEIMRYFSFQIIALLSIIRYYLADNYNPFNRKTNNAYNIVWIICILAYVFGIAIFGFNEKADQNHIFVKIIYFVTFAFSFIIVFLNMKQYNANVLNDFLKIKENIKKQQADINN